MKKLLAILLMSVTVLSFTACGATKGETTTSTQQSAASYASAEEVFNLYWDGVSEKYASIGGNMENAVDGKPAEFKLDAEGSKDMLTYTFFMPENVINNISEAATMMHMMNANTFCGAVIKVSNMSQADAISALKESVRNAPFMCGAPDKLYIATFGDYIFYAYGVEDIIAELQTILSGKAANEFVSGLPF